MWWRDPPLRHDDFVVLSIGDPSIVVGDAALGVEVGELGRGPHAPTREINDMRGHLWGGGCFCAGATIITARLARRVKY
jgi:hypothetical protein